MGQSESMGVKERKGSSQRPKEGGSKETGMATRCRALPGERTRALLWESITQRDGRVHVRDCISHNLIRNEQQG